MSLLLFGDGDKAAGSDSGSYELKFKDELPGGSYPRDPGDLDQIEMGIWGKALDKVERGNVDLINAIASPTYASEWMLKMYEAQHKIIPPVGSTILQRRTAVLGAMSKLRSVNYSKMQKICEGFLGYLPIIKTSPHPFVLGRSILGGPDMLVEDRLKFAFWVELQSAMTGKPYDDAELVAELVADSPAEVVNVWTFWDDEVFSWGDY